MEFFEFFFSGPCWGWRAILLWFMIGTIGNYLVEITKAITKCFRRAQTLDEIREVFDEDYKNDHTASKDDVRS